jgi:hypothetical protein
MAPVPEQESTNKIPSKFWKASNILLFNKTDVGRTWFPGGTFRLKPLACPPNILTAMENLFEKELKKGEIGS